MKDGQIVIVSCSLDLITNPTEIPSRYFDGCRLIPSGNQGSEMILGWKQRRFGLSGGGNQNNATWRRPHGGSFCNQRRQHILA